MKLRRGILFGLWVLSLVAISFYGGTVSYGFFFGITLIPVISIIYLVCVYFRFKVYQELGSRNVVSGQPISYYFVLQNDDLFAFSGVSVRLFSDFSFVEELPEDKEYELLPGESYKYETRLICKYRGEYEVGIREIVVTDFFGLFRVSYKMTGTIKALVVPRIVKVQELKSISDISALIQREAFLRETEPDVVTRDYQAGDELKQIHWKVTAREQKLKVRNRIGEEKQGVALFFDTSRGSKDNRIFIPQENKVLEAVLALSFFFAEKNISLPVYYNQMTVQRRYVEGVKSFESFYKQISEIRFDQDEKPEQTLDAVISKGHLLESKVVFFVLQSINDNIFELVDGLTKRGIIAVLYVVTDENIEDYVKQSNLQRRIIAVGTQTEPEGVL